MFWNKGKKSAPWVSAVIVSAGASSRMDGIDKQGYPLGDVPVVVRSMRLFDECTAVSEIVLVCREEDIARYYALTQDYGILKVRQIVAGGENRQDSVFRGIGACAPDAAFYAIHDGARPLVTALVIEDCLSAAREFGAAAAGVPVKDTVKVVSPEGFILETPPRESLFAIQTPQIFEAALYRRAMEEAKRLGALFTDDCQLVEQYGHRVRVSRGDYANLKITTPEDLVLARALIEYYEGYEGDGAL